MRVLSKSFPKGKTEDQIAIKIGVVLKFFKNRQNCGVTEPVSKKAMPLVREWLAGHESKAERGGWASPYLLIADDAADLLGPLSQKSTLAEALAAYRTLGDPEQASMRASIGADASDLRQQVAALREDGDKLRANVQEGKDANTGLQVSLDAALKNLDAKAREVDELRANVQEGKDANTGLQVSLDAKARGVDERKGDTSKAGTNVGKEVSSELEGREEEYPIAEARRVRRKGHATRRVSVLKILKRAGLPVPTEEQLTEILKDE